MLKHFSSMLMIAMALQVAKVHAQEEKGPPRRPGMLQRPNSGRDMPPGGERPGPEMLDRGLAMMGRLSPLMKALDTDQDGELSAVEIENASKSLLKLDKNGDGVLSNEELRPDPRGMEMPGAAGGQMGRVGPALGPAMLARMFETRDADGDGKLTGDEIPPQMRERLSIVDENGDGAVDKAEAEKAMRRLDGRMNQRPDRQGSGGQGVPPRRPPADKDSGN
ncbi:MAG: hypothetical protein WCI02_17370 [Planctomycetota bacterium]|jgi:Ca2+-binding EF-hand superfamily protein